MALPEIGFDFRLTHWPAPFYPTQPFPLSKLAAEFDVETARIMAWASQLAYEVGVAENEQMLRAILSGWGWDLGGLFEGEVSGFSWLKSARGYVAGSAGTTLIAFSGTEPTQGADWLTDFDLPPDSTDGIHRGFADGVTSVWKTLAPAVANGSRLFITGHSLGGALAAVTAFRLLQAKLVDPGQVRIVTFGMPRTGTAKFADAYRSAGLAARTYRLAHGLDLVPRVPPYEGIGFRHVGNLLACVHGGSFDWASLVADAPEQPPEAAPGIARFLDDRLQDWKIDPDTGAFPGGKAAAALPNLIRDHLMDGYLRALGELKGT